eukprot:9977914-Prorocentrum_lima.AAC.1
MGNETSKSSGYDCVAQHPGLAQPSCAQVRNRGGNKWSSPLNSNNKLSVASREQGGGGNVSNINGRKRVSVM